MESESAAPSPEVFPITPPPLVIYPQRHHTVTCIWLHGFGMKASAWKLLGEHCEHVKFVLPQGPWRKLTINGSQGHAWFDNLKWSGSRFQDGDEDEIGMNESLAIVDELVAEELKTGVPVVVGGFSQGGAQALLYAVTTERPLGGLIVASGRVPIKWKLPSLRNLNNDQLETLPTFWAHGAADPIVKLVDGKAGATFMAEVMGMREIDFRLYNHMKHGYCRQEVMDIKQWMWENFPPPTDLAKL